MHATFRSPIFSILLAWAIVLTSFLPSAVGVATTSSGELLAAELPAGVTINAAPTPVLARAVTASVSKRKDQAVSILRVALLSRKSKKRLDYSKGGKGAGGYEPDVADVVELTRAAIAGAPEQAQELVNEAIAIAPGAASALQALLGSPLSGIDFPIRLRDLDAGIAGAPSGFSTLNPANISGPGGQNIIISPER